MKNFMKISAVLLLTASAFVAGAVTKGHVTVVVVASSADQVSTDYSQSSSFDYGSAYASSNYSNYSNWDYEGSSDGYSSSYTGSSYDDEGFAPEKSEKATETTK